MNGLKMMLKHHLKMAKRLGPYYLLAKLFTDLRGFVESIQFLIDLITSLFN